MRERRLEILNFGTDTIGLVLFLKVSPLWLVSFLLYLSIRLNIDVNIEYSTQLCVGKQLILPLSLWLIILGSSIYNHLWIYTHFAKEQLVTKITTAMKHYKISSNCTTVIGEVDKAFREDGGTIFRKDSKFNQDRVDFTKRLVQIALDNRLCMFILFWPKFYGYTNFSLIAAELLK